MKTTRFLMNSPKAVIAFLFTALMSIGFTASSTTAGRTLAAR